MHTNKLLLALVAVFLLIGASVNARNIPKPSLDHESESPVQNAGGEYSDEDNEAYQPRGEKTRCSRDGCLDTRRGYSYYVREEYYNNNNRYEEPYIVQQYNDDCDY